MTELSPNAAPLTDTRTLTKQAADALFLEGIRPTVATVRGRTGRGSAGTINAALKEWWLELAQRQAAQRSRPDLPLPLLDAADRIWEAALLQAHETLTTYRREAEQKVEDAQAAVSAAEAARQLAESTVATFEAQVAKLEQIRLDLERRLASETVRREESELRTDEVRTALSQRLEEAQERSAQVEQTLRLEQDRFASMERRLVTLMDQEKLSREQAERALTERSATWRSQEAELHRQLQTSREQNAKLQGQKGVLEEQLAMRDRTIESLQHDKATIQTEVITLREQLNSSEKSQEILQTAIADGKALFAHSTQEQTALLERLHVMETKYAMLQGERDSLGVLLKKLSEQ